MAKAVEKKKVKTPTAQKRDIQNEKRRLINKSFKAGVRTAIRKLETDLVSGDADSIKENLNQVYSQMDKAVKRGIFTQNKASRSKARLSARVALKASAPAKTGKA